MPIASAPSSPAKSGSHSAIVEPINAPTRSPDASIAWRKAMPSGMCDARMITSGRAALSVAITPGQSGKYMSYDARSTTGSPRSTAVASAESATVRAYSSSATASATRSSETSLPSRPASSCAAKLEEFAPNVPPVVPTRKTIGSPRPVSRSATAPASQ